MIFGHDTSFWIATAGATVVRLLSMDHSGLSPGAAIFRGVAGAFTAVFTAITFTDPLLTWQALDPSVWKVPTAAILALTGESLVRLVLNIVPKDWAGLAEIIRTWRGK